MHDSDVASTQFKARHAVHYDRVLVSSAWFLEIYICNASVPMTSCMLHTYTFVRGGRAAPTYIYQLVIVLIQIVVTFSSYDSKTCHSFSGVAMRLQHTY